MSNRMSTRGASTTAAIYWNNSVSTDVMEAIARAGLLKYVDQGIDQGVQKRARKLVDRSDWTWASKLNAEKPL